MKILILNDGYFPARNYGGPVVSIKNFTDLIHDEVDTYILASNVEFRANQKLSGIKDGWNRVFNSNVMYIDRNDFTYNVFLKTFIEIKPDLIYINSFFSYKILLPFLKISRKYNIPILLAPRGELCKNALQMKKFKKMIYIFAMKNYMKYCNIYYHSTSDEETNAIIKLLRVKKDRIYLLPNIPTIFDEKIVKSRKEKGHLKAIFVSRIHPKKNLHFLLDCLNSVKGDVRLDIYGPKEDNDYCNKIEEQISKLPRNLCVKYKGNLYHDDIIPTMAKYDCFLFYTLSENYGHVIAEAINAMCIPIISNTTPWNDLEEYDAGLVADLNKKDICVKNIQLMVDSDNNRYQKMIDNLSKYKYDKFKISAIKNEYLNIFKDIIDLENKSYEK